MKKHLFLGIVTISTMSIVTGCTMRGQNMMPYIGGQYTQQTPSTTTPQTPSTTPETPSTTTPEAPSTTTPETPSTQAPQTNNIPSATFDLTAVRQQVANVEQVVNNAQRSGSYLENLNTYRTIKQQIKQVDFTVESMENQVEASYRMGSLDATQFWQFKNELDSMDDRLDFLEDSLEWRLGVDD